ncbi:hypothetical protein [Erythrobacter sp. JK5]|uniref:hypothetical protein n=1 Tax=Erythrobacter sp. JK5 TaxID=2829500 RepID=UPI001BAA7C95|nr:hypothetical protein [Erythrobacter sp. JK5]QUL38971.1 hypothetical protein KDC96_06380 [Erythrobacter sp. JK5]
MASRPPDADGQVCRADSVLPQMYNHPGEVRYTLSLPIESENQALEFLEGIGGDAAGAGRAMTRIGIDAPLIRAQYKAEVEGLARQIAERLDRGDSVEQTARWASEQRRLIVNRMRAKSGGVSQVVYEVRDWRKYGYGGRSYPNMVRHYQGRGVPQSQIPERILRGAQQSNEGVSAAVRNASYLRHGGRVVLVVGVAISAARIWNASDEEMPRVIGEELGGFIGGGLGAGAGVGICIVFGIATSGWGLLACGVVGGAAGGSAGA